MLFRLCIWCSGISNISELNRTFAAAEGARLLLRGPTPPARLVVEAAFSGRGGVQLVLKFSG